MKSATLINLLASTYKVDQKTVALYDRNLKEAGLVPKGRGRHAPPARPQDAALLTIALLSTDKPARAVQRVKRFRNFLLEPEESDGEFPAELKIGPGVTFETAVSNIFSSEHYQFIPYVEVHENARTARIEFVENGEISTAFFRTSGRTESESTQDRKELFGIRQSRGLSSSELMQIWIPFFLERRDGIPYEDMTWETKQEGHKNNAPS